MIQRQVGFTEAVKSAIVENYCNFYDRASRSQYWWYVLFTFIVGCVISAIFYSHPNTLNIVSGLVNLALLLPSLGLCVRRLHDIGKSGWWILLGLIPLVGAIILIVWFCRESQPTPNEYGPVPNLVG